MIYLYDTIFIFLILIIKRAGVSILEDDILIFVKTKDAFLWFEYVIVMVGVIFMPDHSDIEGSIALCFAVALKFTFDLIPFFTRVIDKFFKTKKTNFFKVTKDGKKFIQ